MEKYKVNYEGSTQKSFDGLKKIASEYERCYRRSDGNARYWDDEICNWLEKIAGEIKAKIESQLNNSAFEKMSKEFNDCKLNDLIDKSYTQRDASEKLLSTISRYTRSGVI